MCESESRSVASDSLWPHGLYSPWNSPGQNTGVGSRSLLQGIFPTQGSNPGLPCCRRILYQLSHQGSPRILEWKPLLQWIFLTQESNWCLQLSYQGSPYVYMCVYTYIYFGCAGFFVAAHRLLLGAVSRVLFVAAHGLLIVVASLVVEHRLWVHELPWMQRMGSRAWAQ